MPQHQHPPSLTYPQLVVTSTNATPTKSAPTKLHHTHVTADSHHDRRFKVAQWHRTSKKLAAATGLRRTRCRLEPKQSKVKLSCIIPARLATPCAMQGQ
eukprot:1161879-Pelagomonas_calceolata.AAC.3